MHNDDDIFIRIAKMEQDLVEIRQCIIQTREQKKKIEQDLFTTKKLSEFYSK